MFGELLKTILFITIFLLICNTIGFIQGISNNMPDYIMLLTIICFLIVAWVYVIKLIKSNEDFKYE